MKFTVESSELQKALMKISGVVPSKSTLPILENILFSLSANSLKLIATDLEISMSATLDVKGNEDGYVKGFTRDTAEFSCRHDNKQN